MAKWHRTLPTISIILTAVPLAAAPAKPMAPVSRAVWAELTDGEREELRQRFVVDVMEPASFGFIFDAQGEEQSTPGTSIGTSLGSALGSAAYVDRVIGGGTYSAKTHLATSVVGALLGSFLDNRGKRQFQFRYAVKLGDGRVQYFDETRSDTFRHPPGVCVAVPALAPIDQELCSQTPTSVREKYLKQPYSAGLLTNSAHDQVRASSDHSAASETSIPIFCRSGALAPVQTTAHKCEAIGGSIVK